MKRIAILPENNVTMILETDRLSTDKYMIGDKVYELLPWEKAPGNALFNIKEHVITWETINGESVIYTMRFDNAADAMEEFERRIEKYGYIETAHT